MLDIKPFKGTKPYKEQAENLIAPSTDHLSDESIIDIHEKNYWNYLKILNPVGQLKEKDSLFEARLHFDEMKKNHVIKKDFKKNFYIYQIDFFDHTQLGFLSLVILDDFRNKKIKVHEKIYENRMKERADQMLNINTQIGPIYVSYPYNNEIENLLKSHVNKVADYDFESFDKSNHKLWCIEDNNFQKNLQDKFMNVESLYICDGHHRIGAMNLISDVYKSKNKNFDHVMIAAFPSNQSKIYDYNRVIKDLNGLTEKEFIEILSKNFEVNLQDKPFRPSLKNQFGMYHENKWYSLGFKKNINSDNLLDNLDINILNDYCLKPFLNIKNVNNDERIRFISGFHGLEALENKVNENKDSVAFSIFPCDISDVFKVADSNQTMPPKSTWFDPKPLDGLVVYEFDQN